MIQEVKSKATGYLVPDYIVIENNGVTTTIDVTTTMDVTRTMASREQ